MSYPINQKINPSMQASTGLSMAQLQAVDSEKIRQGVNNSPVAKVADQKSNPALFAGVMLPAWLLTYLGMNKIAQKSRGTYDQSMYQKIDNFEKKITSSKAYDNSVVKGIKNAFKWTKDFVNTKIVDNSGILRAILRTPSKPEHKQVLMMAGGINTELASTGAQLLEKYTEDGMNIEKLKELGFADKAAFDKVVKNPTLHVKDIKDIIVKQASKPDAAAYKPQGALKIPLSKKYLTDYMPEKMKKAFINDIHWSEYANKMKAVEKPGLSKFTLRIIEGMTNAGTGAVGGAALVSIMGAWFITDAIVRSIKAPKGHGEKGKTFAENMLYNLGFYLTMPLGIKIMHGFGGLQYTGMKKEDIEKFRSELKVFNEEVKKGTKGKFGEIKAYEAEKIRIRKLLTDAPRSGNWFQRKIIHAPFRRAGKMFTAGLENFAPFNPKGITKETAPGIDGFFKKRLGQFFTHGKARGLKWAAGSVRFITFLFLVAPFLAKFFAKGSHLVFGKPTKSILDEGKEDKKEAQQPQMLQQPVQPTPQPAMAPIQPSGNMMGQNNSRQNNMVSNPVNNDPSKNLVNMYSNKPASREMIATDKSARTYSYIPSTEGVKVAPSNEKEVKAQELLDKAEKQEEMVLKQYGISP